MNKPVNLGALTKWVDDIPLDVRPDIRQIAPMLETLGYDPDAYPPFYGTPDKEVKEQSDRLQRSLPSQIRHKPPAKDAPVMDIKRPPIPGDMPPRY